MARALFYSDNTHYSQVYQGEAADNALVRGGLTSQELLITGG